MKTEIGWVNEDGTETLNNDFDNSTEFETAESMVAMLNSTMSDECWFAMAGDEQCPNPCADCEGAMHHWLHTVKEDAELLQCKHCETYRTVTGRDEI